LASARDVAQYILETKGPMTSMKLQKLVYYCQAWSVVWDDDCLFDDPIEAWKNGPVVRDLWEANKGKFRVSEIPERADSANLDQKQQATVQKVVEFYGDKNAQWLSDLTHMEEPWVEAYGICQNHQISLETISEYYSTLGPNVQEAIPS